MTKTPPGGPANIGGIIYQMLWCLLRLTRFEVEAIESDDDGLTGALLVLEPRGGGGDARIESRSRYVVTPDLLTWGT